MQHQQRMITNTNRVLKFEPKIRTRIVAEYTFFTVITFSNINSFTLYHNITFIMRPIRRNQKKRKKNHQNQKDDHHACLQFYKT